MLRFLKRRQDKPEERFAPGTKIPYRENLVKELTSEHHTLVRLFNEIVRAQSEADDSKVYELLTRFKSKLRSHLLKENTYLYIYLKYISRHDKDNSTMITNMQKEMGEIGKDAFNFVKKWTRSSKISYGDDFVKELSSVGESLSHRMKHEEQTLYPIYSEPDTDTFTAPV